MNKKGKLRICWTDPIVGTSGKGAFLFDTRRQAEPTLARLRKVFPMNHHWLEDEAGNRIDVDIVGRRGGVPRLRILLLERARAGLRGLVRARGGRR